MTAIAPGLLVESRGRTASLWRVESVERSVTLRPLVWSEHERRMPSSVVSAAALWLHYRPARVRCLCGRVKPGPKRGATAWVCGGCG